MQRFAERYEIPSHRIIASEFWYDRRLEGAAAYLSDLMKSITAEVGIGRFTPFAGGGSMDGVRL